mmetsp:Transcript_62201/g.145777  ORF Transcript_62201/g.145777 Transcript_62201/m.145777 type:complete len:236 (+) Transcript_62201:1015-1722(+)
MLCTRRSLGSTSEPASVAVFRLAGLTGLCESCESGSLEVVDLEGRASRPCVSSCAFSSASSCARSISSRQRSVSTALCAKTSAGGAESTWAASSKSSRHLMSEGGAVGELCSERGDSADCDKVLWRENAVDRVDVSRSIHFGRGTRMSVSFASVAFMSSVEHVELVRARGRGAVRDFEETLWSASSRRAAASSRCNWLTIGKSSSAVYTKLTCAKLLTFCARAAKRKEHTVSSRY